jgi:O-antigen/teichoic acid export membrane protein
MSLKKNVAYNTILTVSNVAFPIVTTPYVSRALGVENIGIVSFAMTYASYFALFAALGIPMYGMRETARLNNNAAERNKVFSELFAINCLSTVVCSAAYLATVFAVPALYEERVFLLIAGASVFFVPFGTDWFFAGREQFKLITIRSLATKIVSAAGLFVFVRSADDIIPYLILNTVAHLSGQAWNFVYMLRNEVKISFAHLNMKRHVRFVLILFASNIAVSIYTMLNTLILGFMSDYTQVGYYASAIKTGRLVLPVVTAMAPVVIARISALKNEPDREEQLHRLLNHSFGTMMMTAVPATIGLIMIAPRFVPVFFGAEFMPVVPSMQALSLLILIIGINNFFAVQILVGNGFDNKVFIVLLSGTVSGFCLNLLLIPFYGALGASIASVVAEIIVTVAAVVFTARLAPVRLCRKNMLQPIIASVPIVFVSVGLNSVTDNNSTYLLLTVATSAALYFLIMTAGFKNEEANQIVYSVLKKIRKLVVSG